MNDVTFFWIALFAYLAASILSALHIAVGKRSTHLAARSLMLVGVASTTVALALRWIASGHIPLTSMFGYLVVFSWAIVIGYLIYGFRQSQSMIGAFVAPVAFFTLAAASLFPKEINQQLMPALQSYWLQIHVSMAVLGEGAFGVGFAAAAMHIFKEWDPSLKRRIPLGPVVFAAVTLSSMLGLLVLFGSRSALKGANPDPVPWTLSVFASLVVFAALVAVLLLRRRQIASRLPDVDRLDNVEYASISLGYPLYTLGALVAGAIWAYKAWGSPWSWDPKEVGAAIVWFIYTGYLHTRFHLGWRGRRSAVFAIIGFLSALFTLFGNLFLGGLHAYV
jgi:cytochrome c-type biogenesis protein CcsB